MYNVRVVEPNPGLMTPLLDHFAGPQGELAAAMRDFTRAPAEEVTGRKDLLIDIATEALNHLKVIGSIVSMLKRGAIAQRLTSDPASNPVTGADRAGADRGGFRAIRNLSRCSRPV